MAQDMRITAIEPGTRPGLGELESLIRAERFGEIPLLYQVLLHSPAITAGWERMLTAVRKQTSVAPDLREMIILRVAILNGAAFEFEQHEPHARAAGVTDAKITALKMDPVPSDRLSEAEALVMELTDRMTRDVAVQGALIERLKERWSEQEVVELVATVAAYNMVSRFLVALNIVH